MPSKEVEARRGRTRADYAFHQEYRTRWFDNDMYAHLNNTVYTQLFDSIINSYLVANCGMDPFSAKNDDGSEGPKMKQIAIIATSYCDYFASVSFPDILELGLRVSRLGSSSVSYEVGVFRQGEEAVKVVGGYTHVFCDRDNMRPAKGGMEDVVRKGLEPLVVADRAKL